MQSSFWGGPAWPKIDDAEVISGIDLVAIKSLGEIIVFVLVFCCFESGLGQSWPREGGPRRGPEGFGGAFGGAKRPSAKPNDVWKAFWGPRGRPGPQNLGKLEYEF